MTRYEDLFARLQASGQGALVPFVMLGDPTPAASLAIIDELIAGGADALELGFPFSDPVADGPTIQAAHLRALEAGVDTETCFDLLAQIRARHPQVPIGLLVYANLPFSWGAERFYAECARVGVDSVLLPDVPTREGEAFAQAAAEAGVDAVFIAPPQGDARTLEQVAKYSRGYIYAVSRVGVTGTENAAETEGLDQVVARLREHTDLPILLGFGISQPEHVSAALAAGADGAITGSAVVNLVAQLSDEDLTLFPADLPAEGEDPESLVSAGAVAAPPGFATSGPHGAGGLGSLGAGQAGNGLGRIREFVAKMKAAATLPQQSNAGSGEAGASGNTGTGTASSTGNAGTGTAGATGNAGAGATSASAHGDDANASPTK
ncbi:tryptophan synthase subunit alpha [Boudabousia tangfeifanii]|uniref:Tryptophan synthase alpha chain n=1 Tax=Boudabousia tangfeifanii TaxID=1912795 RepID=A0A1D9MMC9_9ACTO|nr:tryptophan synthase subunit alpha [Boudabousia tangfeifanii]